MSRTGFQYALSALAAVVANPGEYDQGVLASVHAGLNAAAGVGRELSDLEQLALDRLMDQLVPEAEAKAEPVIAEVEAEAEHLSSEVSSEVTAGEGQPSGAEVTQPSAVQAAPAEPVSEPGGVAGAAGSPGPTHDELFAEQPHDENDAAA